MEFRRVLFRSVVPVVADGEGFLAGEAARGGVAGERAALVAAAVEDVEQSEVALRILGAGHADGLGAGRPPEQLVKLPQRPDRPGEKHLDRVFGQGVFERLDLPGGGGGGCARGNSCRQSVLPSFDFTRAPLLAMTVSSSGN